MKPPPVPFSRLALLSGVITLALAAAWVAGCFCAISLAAFGPQGRPAIVMARGGVLYVGFANVRIEGQTWSILAQQTDGVEADNTIDLIHQYAGGVPTTVNMGATAVLDWVHEKGRFLLGGGDTALGVADAHFTVAAAPIWALIILPALGTLLGGSTVLRTRRRRQFNLCVACGYDLRGSPTRCPECGRESGVLATEI